jgi:hypothetical protein
MLSCGTEAGGLETAPAAGAAASGALPEFFDGAAFFFVLRTAMTSLLDER